MKLIVGLGNPGEKYKNNRHNIGFLMLDDFQHRRSATPRQFQKNINSFVAECTREGEQILLLKPQTFMNLSGSPVVALVRYFHLNSKDVVIIHDDLDLPFGLVKLKENGGHGGHNGVRDIIQKLGTDQCWRVKIGIDRPIKKEDVHDYVLSNFSKQEQLHFQEIFDNGEKKREELLKNLQTNEKKI